MGQVIEISKASRAEAADPIMRFIDECYARLERNVPGFVGRQGQRNLSKDLCRALVAGKPLAAEAPTGTGKTLAYLIGALAAVEKLQTTKMIPIVVATATVGLQSQVLMGDLPMLVTAGIVGPHDAVLAKGRSRYFCVSAAERFAGSKLVSSQDDFFDQTANEESENLRTVHEMLEAWNARVWAGDRDNYTGNLKKSWPLVQAQHETCVGHKCDHYSACPFFNARRVLSHAKIIVANHDLVLSDLAMARDGETDPLFPSDQYVVVFDEAHHLPDKALDVGTASLSLVDAELELPKVKGYPKAWRKSIDLSRLLDKQNLTDEDFDPSLLLNAIHALKGTVQALEVNPDNRQFRFQGGALPENIMRLCKDAYLATDQLLEAIQDATQALKQSTLGEKFPEIKPIISEILYSSAFFGSFLGRLSYGLELLLSKDRAVRWAFHSDAEVSLHSCPLEGADVLKSLLWGSPRVRVGLVSATLSDFEGFERFKRRVGYEDLLTLKLPHIFPYQENTLQIVRMRHTPRYEEKQEYLQELKTVLPSFIDPREGSLVLFSSWSQMRELVPVLRARFGAHVLCQGDMGIKELLVEHKTRIRNGRGNILCGLATLAEGLDLPGDLCTHVLICALPFVVPTTPVEIEHKELLGDRYFEMRALPDALVKLTQMCGRLMRRESDRGKITMFDSRLSDKAWGRRMLKALPEFRKLTVYPPRLTRV